MPISLTPPPFCTLAKDSFGVRVWALGGGRWVGARDRECKYAMMHETMKVKLRPRGPL
jgi:hypothetical protein